MPIYKITGEGYYKYRLLLNPMMGGVEQCVEILTAETMAEIKAFYDSQLVEPYSDEGPDCYQFGSTPQTKTYHKSFRKGGPLEWYNPLSNPQWDNEEGFRDQWGHGVHFYVEGVGEIVRHQRIR